MNTLTRRLVQRILAARGKGHLQDLLKAAKERGGDKAKFNVSGDTDQLEQSVHEAISGKFLTEAEVMTLADDLEEIGGQHLYLFKLTKAGKEALTPELLKKAFAKCNPSVAYYADEPTGNAVEWVERNGAVYLKQVHTAEFWELDREKSVWNDNERRRFWNKVQRRAINLFLADAKKGTAEVCIDRLKGENDEKLAEQELARFLKALEPTVSYKDHLIPVKISSKFGDLVTGTLDEAFMNADGVFDESIAHKMSNRRKGTKGSDVRKNSGYNLDQEDYDREGVTIYWFTEPAPKPAKGDEAKGAQPRRSVYTIISAVERVIDKKKIEHCKVYISAKISAKDRAHVIGRIRHFAG